MSGAESRAAGLVAVGVSLSALIVYLATLAPGVTLVDSGELAVAVGGGGVAHPPGFPLYLWLAQPFAALPGGDVAWRLNLFSALAAALAAAATSVATWTLLRSLRAKSPSGATRRERRAAARRATSSLPVELPAFATLAGGGAAGLLLAFSRPLWSFATVVEVYSLNTLMLAALFALLFAWRRRASESAAALSLLVPAALLFGLALGVHLTTVAAALPAIALLALGRLGWRFLGTRGFALAAGVSLAAALGVYATLPLRAAPSAPLVWGDPTDLERLLRHVSGAQYRSYFESGGEALARGLGSGLGELASAFAPSWAPLALLLAAVGLAWLARRDGQLVGFLALVVGANLAYASLYEIAEDKAAYYLPSALALALAAGVGTAVLAARAAARLGAARRLPVAALALVAPGLGLLLNWPASDRSRDRIAAQFVDDALATVAPGGLVLTQEWQLYAPWLYRAEFERLRPDALLLDIHLLRRGWYVDRFVRRGGATAERVREEVSAYRAVLGEWERDPDGFLARRGAAERIGQRFTELVLALVARHPAPVYLSGEVVFAPDATMAEAVARLSRERAAVPQGLLFEIAPRDLPPAPALLPFRADFRPGGRAIADPDRVVAQKVRPLYLGMLLARARALAGGGDALAAGRALDEAAALDPASPLPARERARLLAPGSH